jgi:hypothetical protein
MSFESFRNDDFFELPPGQSELQAQGEVLASLAPLSEEDLSDYSEREQLPWLKPPNQKASIFKVLKDMIGKDITKFAVPVHFNEPVSMLQK